VETGPLVVNSGIACRRAAFDGDRRGDLQHRDGQQHAPLTAQDGRAQAGGRDPERGGQGRPRVSPAAVSQMDPEGNGQALAGERAEEGAQDAVLAGEPSKRWPISAPPIGPPAPSRIPPNIILPASATSSGTRVPVSRAGSVRL
jgi:hypothetical protein